MPRGGDSVDEENFGHATVVAVPKYTESKYVAGRVCERKRPLRKSLRDGH